MRHELGSLSIRSLFAELDYNDFPNQVNEPTLARLNQFLNGVGRHEAEGVTVRALVQRMMKISVPRSCQCQPVFSQLCLAGTHLSAEQRRTRQVLEFQRVVVNCSAGVFSIMQEAYQEWTAIEANIMPPTIVTDSSKGEVVAITRREMHSSRGEDISPGIATEVGAKNKEWDSQL